MIHSQEKLFFTHLEQLEQPLTSEVVRQSFHKDDIVRVLRTSGKEEDGWRVAGFNSQNGDIIVHSIDNKYKKEIPPVVLYNLNRNAKTFAEWHKIWLRAGGHMSAMFDAKFFPLKMSAEQAWQRLKNGRCDVTELSNIKQVFKSHFTSQTNQSHETNNEVKKNSYDQVDQIITNRFDNPLIIKGKSGIMALATDEGINYKSINEDSVVVNSDPDDCDCAFAVVDGMGGMGQGDKATKILAEELQKGWQGRKIAENIQKLAHQRMRREGVGDGGACYVAGQIDKYNLMVSQSGDVRLVVIDSNGRVKFSTTDEGLFYEVSNAVQGTEQGKTTTYQVQLQKKDRIVVASDGVFDNFYQVPYKDFKNAIINGQFTYQEAVSLANQKLADLIDRKSPAEAIKLIDQTLVREMKGAGKPDNRAVIIYDVE